MTNKRTKYPRTFHLPFSPGKSSDDKSLKDLSPFENKEVVVTVKMDGENTTLYRDGFHARSIDSRHHPSRDWLARWHASIAHDIPNGWRICGENLYAQHSIVYDDLPSYFLGFSIWDEHNNALDWDSTLEYFDIIGIHPVDTIYRGIFNEQKIPDLVNEFDTIKNEGFVVRLCESFNYSDFNKSVAKWVRKGHVQTTKHWMHTSVNPNNLSK